MPKFTQQFKAVVTIRTILTGVAVAGIAWGGHRLTHEYHFVLKSNVDLLWALFIQVVIISLAVFTILKILLNIKFQARRDLLILLWISMLLVGHNLVWIEFMDADEFMTAFNLDTSFFSLFIVLLFYTILLVIPFVPGLEFGLIIMIVFGVAGVIAAWLGTVVGLSIAFAIGRMISRGPLGRLVLDKLKSDKRWERKLESLQHSSKAPWRYVVLAGLVNLPGNSVFGGGGGISILCGFSGAFKFKPFALTMAFATLPIPIAIGTGIFSADRLFF